MRGKERLLRIDRQVARIVYPARSRRENRAVVGLAIPRQLVEASIGDRLLGKGHDVEDRFDQGGKEGFFAVPPLVLTPLMLGPAQWGPVLPTLTANYCTISLGGPHQARREALAVRDNPLVQAKGGYGGRIAL
jgi:hypothetical protein